MDTEDANVTLSSASDISIDTFSRTLLAFKFPPPIDPSNDIDSNAPALSGGSTDSATHLASRQRQDVDRINCTDSEIHTATQPRSDVMDNLSQLSQGESASERSDIPENMSYFSSNPSSLLTSSNSREGGFRGDEHDAEIIRSIPDEIFVKQLLVFLRNGTGCVKRPKRLSLKEEACRVVNTVEGAFHHCRMIEVDGDSDTYVVKVPFAGAGDQWTWEDMGNMDHEALMMFYIRRMTSLPVPEVVAFNARCMGELEYPFIIMKMIPGNSAYHLWFDMDSEDRSLLVQGNWPTRQVSERRKNFLSSLAHIMADLQKLEFPTTGMVDWELDWNPGPDLVSRYIWQEPCDNNTDGANCKPRHIEHKPCKTSLSYFTRNLEAIWPADPSSELPEADQLLRRGVHEVLAIILSTPAFCTSRKNPYDDKEAPSFVLAHNDLDLQNILVDDEGNITGILDWDGCSIVPRSIGYASLPLFLRKDWLPGFSAKNAPHMSWTLNNYRMEYAKAMKETGSPDARFTRKSALYHAVAAALGDGGDVLDMIQNFFLEIPELCKLDYVELLKTLGMGNGSLSSLLSRRLQEMLEPDTLGAIPSESLALLRELPFLVPQISDPTSTPPSAHCTSRNVESEEGQNHGCEIEPKSSAVETSHICHVQLDGDELETLALLYSLSNQYGLPYPHEFDAEEIAGNEPETLMLCDADHVPTHASELSTSAESVTEENQASQGDYTKSPSWLYELPYSDGTDTEQSKTGSAPWEIGEGMEPTVPHTTESLASSSIPFPNRHGGSDSNNDPGRVSGSEFETTVKVSKTDAADDANDHIDFTASTELDHDDGGVVASLYDSLGTLYFLSALYDLPRPNELEMDCQGMDATESLILLHVLASLYDLDENMTNSTYENDMFVSSCSTDEGKESNCPDLDAPSQPSRDSEFNDTDEMKSLVYLNLLAAQYGLPYPQEDETYNSESICVQSIREPWLALQYNGVCHC
jgi:hypothetical protein